MNKIERELVVKRRERGRVRIARSNSKLNRKKNKRGFENLGREEGRVKREGENGQIESEKEGSISESLFGNLSDGYCRASLKLEREREERESGTRGERECESDVLGSKGKGFSSTSL